MICPTCQQPADTGEACPACGGPLLVEGRYRLEEEVGRGALGAVYRARDLAEDREVAVKSMILVHPDAKRVERAVREVAVLEQLRHPAVPAYLDHVGIGRQLFLVQELVPGRTLQAELEARRFDQGEVLDIVAGVLDALAWLHGRSPPVIHRDIKPGNVMRRPDGSLVLLDFGSVRDALADPQLGGSTVAGTFGYMAPEQFRGDASPATDIFGVGALAVALLSRRDPAGLMDWSGRLKWQGSIDVHPAVGALLAELLEPDPTRRPSDAAALAGRVRQLRDGLTRGTLPVPRPARRQHTWLPRLGLVVILALFVGGAATLLAAFGVAYVQTEELKARSAGPVVEARYGEVVTDPGVGQAFLVLREDEVIVLVDASLQQLGMVVAQARLEGAEPADIRRLGWTPPDPVAAYAAWWLDDGWPTAVIFRGPGQGRRLHLGQDGQVSELARWSRNDLFNAMVELDWLGWGSEWWPEVD